MTTSLKLDSRSKRERYGVLKTRSPYLLAESEPADWSSHSTVTSNSSTIKGARMRLRDDQKSGGTERLAWSVSGTEASTANPDIALDTVASATPRDRAQTVSGAEGYRYRSRIRDSASNNVANVRSRRLSTVDQDSDIIASIGTRPGAQPLAITGTRFSVQPAKLEVSVLQTVVEQPHRQNSIQDGVNNNGDTIERLSSTIGAAPSSLTHGTATTASVVAPITTNAPSAVAGARNTEDVSFYSMIKSAPTSPRDSKAPSFGTPKARRASGHDPSTATVTTNFATVSNNGSAGPISGSNQKLKTNKSRWRSLVDAIRRRRGISQAEAAEKADRRAEKKDKDKDKRKRAFLKSSAAPQNSNLAALTMQTALGVTVTVASENHESSTSAGAFTWTKGARARTRDALRLMETITDIETQSHSDFEALALERADDERPSTPTVSLHEDALQALDVEANPSSSFSAVRKASASAINNAVSHRRHRQSDSETERIPLALRLIDDVACIDEAARIGLHKSLGASTIGGCESSDLEHLRVDYLPLAGGNWFRVINEKTRTEKLFIADDRAMLQLPFIRRNHLVDRNKSYALFLKAHKCHHLVPTRTKVVAFDTQLSVKKAFFALVSNGVRAAPLWDSTLRRFVGMLTVTDFIRVLQKQYCSGQIAEIEAHRIATWRDQLCSSSSSPDLVTIDCEASLFDAVSTLASHHVHRLPVLEQARHSILYILTYRRILKFLHCYMRQLMLPDFMKKTLDELRIGTFDVAVAHRDMLLLDVLSLMESRGISAVPVVDDRGHLIDIYSKFDVLNLAAENTYDDLNITVSEALNYRRDFFEGVVTCRLDETLSAVIERLLEKHVHRLVIVERDASNRDTVAYHVKGVLSLSDVLHFIVLDQDVAC